MKCFEILGISNDADVKTIKKAYACLVKIHNPEDDPEGYQIIRNAYDESMKIAKTAKKDKLQGLNPSLIGLDDMQVDTEESKEKDNDINDDGYNQYKKNNLKELNSFYENGDKVYKRAMSKVRADSFIKRLSDIYSNINTRIDKKEWENALAEIIEFDVLTYEYLKTSIIYFLFTHMYLPHEIYILFNDYFELKNDELKLNRNFAADLIEELFYHIENEDKLSYDYLGDVPVESLEEYLNLRELAYKAVEANDYKHAENYIMYAYKIYPNDPELLKINAKLEYLNFNYKEAKFLLKRALEINDSDKQAIVFLDKMNIFTYLKGKYNCIYGKHKQGINKTFKHAKSFFFAVFTLVIICSVLTYIFNDRTTANVSNSSSITSNQFAASNIIESVEGLQDPPVGLEYADNDAEFLISIINKSECIIKAEDVKATDYYMLKESINDKDGNEVNCIYIDDNSKEIMKQNIKSRVYIGRVSDNIVLFTDYYQIKDIKDKEVKVIGKKIDNKLYTKIKKDNSDYEQGDGKWFPDCIFMNVNEKVQKEK